MRVLRFEEVKKKKKTYFIGVPINSEDNDKTTINSTVILEKFVFHSLQQHLSTLEN